MVITQHLPNVEGWKVGHQTGIKMMAGWLYFVLYKQVTGSTAGQDKCAEKFGCSTTQFKRMITGKWQEGGKRRRSKGHERSKQEEVEKTGRASRTGSREEKSKEDKEGKSNTPWGGRRRRRRRRLARLSKFLKMK